MLSSDECKKIVLLVARPEMQVRVNRCTEPRPGLYCTFTITISNELLRSGSAKVPDKRRKNIIAELCPLLANKENNMLLPGLVCPKLNNSFPADKVSRYTNKAESTNMVLVKYEVEVEHCALLV